MTPKKKASELVAKMFDNCQQYNLFSNGDLEFNENKTLVNAKNCALVVANEILNDIPYINNTDKEASKRVFWIYTIDEIKKL